MARMTRVSPPELARELPGPHVSIKMTRAFCRNKCSAVHPPNAPAPTTTIFSINLFYLPHLALSLYIHFPSPHLPCFYLPITISYLPISHVFISLSPFLISLSPLF